MANILICGDSWGCGEWNVTCTEILHTGLEAYLSHDGHSVTNISKGGVSNLDRYNRLSMWFERFGSTGIDTVFVFQTEYTRDFKHSVDSDWNVKVIADLAAQWIERFYMRLSELSQQYNCGLITCPRTIQDVKLSVRVSPICWCLINIGLIFRY